MSSDTKSSLDRFQRYSPFSPGKTVRIVKGEHAGKLAKVNGSEGWFYHLQLLTSSGRKQSKGLVSLHKASIAPFEESHG